MKKTKLLSSLLPIATLPAAIVPFMSSCSSSQSIYKAIPTDMLYIEGHTLHGFKSDADLKQLTKYNTLVIPEGIKFIDAGAFDSKFNVPADGGYINTIVFPSSIVHIGAGAFKTNTAIRWLDFSSWTENSIYYAKFEAEAFAGFGGNGYIKTNDSITSQSRYKLYTLLSDGGLINNWFAKDSTDKVSVDKTWMKQESAYGSSEYLFKLNVQLPAGSKVYASVTWTGGTEGIQVDEFLDDEGTAPTIPYDDYGNMTLPVTLLNHKNKGDYAKFSVTFTACQKNDDGSYTPLWRQNFDGFELVNTTNFVTGIEAKAEKAVLKVGETTKIISTVTPETADDKTVYYGVVAGPHVLDLDGNTGEIKALAPGEATVRAIALGSLSAQMVYQDITITVET